MNRHLALVSKRRHGLSEQRRSQNLFRVEVQRPGQRIEPIAFGSAVITSLWLSGENSDRRVTSS